MSRCSIVQSDCMDFLKSLEADSVDLVFTSPPYELARHYLENGKNLGIARKTEAWVKWMVEVITECSRVCKGLVAFVVEGQTKDFKYSAGPLLLGADLHRAGLNLRKPPIFRRVGIPGSGGPDWLRNDYEFIICVTRAGKLPWSDSTACGHPPKWAPGGEMSYRNAEGSRRNSQDRPRARVKRAKKKADGRKPIFRHSEDKATPSDHDRLLNLARANPGNVITCKVGGGLMGHPLAHENEAPFPLKLAEFFVRSFCPPDGLVSDPFGGSFTTAHAAIENDRRFTGCDLRESMVKIGLKRMAGITPSLPGLS